MLVIYQCLLLSAVLLQQSNHKVDLSLSGRYGTPSSYVLHGEAHVNMAGPYADTGMGGFLLPVDEP